MPNIKSPYGRNNALGDSPPELSDILHRIETMPRTKTWFKAALIILALTGARISEVIPIQRQHIQYMNYKTSVFAQDDLSNVTHVEFKLQTLKRRRTKAVWRTVPVAVNPLTRKLLTWLWKYLSNFQNPESKIIGRNDESVRQSIKKYFHKDFYPHLFRHALATADAKNGMPIYTLKNKFGWVSAEMPFVYIGVDKADILEASKKVYANIMDNDSVGGNPLGAFPLRYPNAVEFDGLVVKKKVVLPQKVRKKVVL